MTSSLQAMRSKDDTNLPNRIYGNSRANSENEPRVVTLRVLLNANTHNITMQDRELLTDSPYLVRPLTRAQPISMQYRLPWIPGTHYRSLEDCCWLGFYCSAAAGIVGMAYLASMFGQ